MIEYSFNGFGFQKTSHIGILQAKDTLGRHAALNLYVNFGSMLS